MRQRAEQAGALPAGKSTGRHVGRATEEMHRAAFQPLRPVERAIGAFQFDVDALFLEETELDGGDGDEIRRRVEIGDAKPERQTALPADFNV